MKKKLYYCVYLWLAVSCLFFTSCEQADRFELAGTQETSVSDSEEDQKSSDTDAEVEKKNQKSLDADTGVGKKDKKSSNVDTKVAGKKQRLSETDTGVAGKIPEYAGNPYVEIEGNQPKFTKKEKKQKSFERYSKLDSLGRCGVAFANIGRDLMPKEERGSIVRVKPSGWQTVKYRGVEGRYLYNRCHLIGYQLTAENANERNLVTGTRYMNVEGMLPFENMAADYVKETGNHVLYRVTPYFEGKDLVAKGVQMEAYSVEDEGDGVCFNVFVYNVQPGIRIDYATGDSREEDGTGIGDKEAEEAARSETDGGEEKAGTDAEAEQMEIRGNRRSKIYHCPGQASYDEMADSDYLVIFYSEEEALDAGYRKAKR